MTIAVVISFIISSLILNTPFLAQALGGEQKIASALAKNEGFVLAAAERIKKWPQEAHDFFYSQNNNLPQNEDRETYFRKINENSFDIPARNGIVIDKETESVLWQKQADEICPLASISKLMTALVFLDHNPGWETVYKIKREDRREGGKIYLYLGDEVKVRDLFLLSLISSANTATMALAHSTGLDETIFVDKMNTKARALGLDNTNFFDPVGLSDKNVSTAEEVARLAKISFLKKEIREAGLLKEYEFTTLGGRAAKIYSTDYLLLNFPQNGISIIGGKTGYTELAGFCFVGEFADGYGHELISVVLGASSNEGRFSQTKDLIGWVYSSYEWP